jgi:hypothetical protein
MSDGLLINHRRAAINPQVMAVLKDVLARAEAGQVTSIACICIGPNGSVATPGAGTQIAEMNMAADLFKKSLITALEGDRVGIKRPA